MHKEDWTVCKKGMMCSAHKVMELKRSFLVNLSQDFATKDSCSKEGWSFLKTSMIRYWISSGNSGHTCWASADPKSIPRNV